jgi:hypothetical protein
MPHSQVWEGSRGRQSGNVHLHVHHGPATFAAANGRALTRDGGVSLCGRRGWYEREPYEGEQRCPRCVTLAARATACRGRRPRMAEPARQGTAPRRSRLSGLCARGVSFSHMKRHLAAHDRHGASRAATDEEWLAFLDATGWPTNLTPAGALLRRRSNSRRSNPDAPDG